jgi:hypothetical protein
MPTPLPETPRPEVEQRPMPAMTEEEAAVAGDALIRRALRDEPVPTAYRDDTPLPAVGSTPPVAQPGRPPQSAKAVDDSVRMLAASVLVIATGVSGSGLMIASDYADPVVVGLICAAPPVALLSLKRVVNALGKAAKDAAPTEIHNHGPVVHDHREVTNNNRWWGKSTSSN